MESRFRSSDDNQPVLAEPPSIPTAAAVAESAPEGSGRWWVHIAILTSYPLTMGLLGAMMQGEAQGPALAPNLPLLMSAMAGEFLFFAIFFLLARLASKINADQLLMGTDSVNDSLLWRSVLDSIGLRLLTIGFAVGFAVALKMAGGTDNELSFLRPKVEHLVDPQALVDNPLFLLANMTLVSFLMGGLREELWRAGMLTGILSAFPKLKASWQGKLIAVTLIAVVFGLGHLPQGWGGVVMTFVVGWGLGIIMIRRKSLWEPALAHGFFNATTFLLLYLASRFQPEALGLGG